MVLPKVKWWEADGDMWLPGTLEPAGLEENPPKGAGVLAAGWVLGAPKELDAAAAEVEKLDCRGGKPLDGPDAAGPKPPPPKGWESWGGAAPKDSAKLNPPLANAEVLAGPGSASGRGWNEYGEPAAGRP